MMNANLSGLKIRNVRNSEMAFLSKMHYHLNG